MPRATSADLRRRIIQAWKKRKLTTLELAELFGVGEATVGRLKRLFLETGDVEPKAHGGGRHPIIAADQEQLVVALVQAHPDWTEEEFAAALAKEQGIQASAITVGRVIRRLGFSVKKKRSSRKSGTARRSRNVDASTNATSRDSPLRVWFLWTKRARTSR
jgi:transposase